MERINLELSSYYDYLKPSLDTPTYNTIPILTIILYHPPIDCRYRPSCCISMFGLSRLVYPVEALDSSSRMLFLVYNV